MRSFAYQYEYNVVYRDYCNLLKVKPESIKHFSQIPFLPISFFKTHEVKSFEGEPQITFTSSGTTGSITSKHQVGSLEIYEKSFLSGFTRTYGDPEDYVILGLLPSYLEREGSSLIYMVDKLIKLTKNPKSGFYLNNYKDLLRTIDSIGIEKKIFIIGVSYALMDLADEFRPNLERCIVMETGGMKGHRKEITKIELHNYLKKGLKINDVHSEYGMTELLSQAYSIGNGIFETPPWMKVLIREYNDPFTLVEGKTGGINIIDLANIHSCSFIATQDLGRRNKDQFEIMGRFDNSDLRGCNLLIQ